MVNPNQNRGNVTTFGLVNNFFFNQTITEINQYMQYIGKSVNQKLLHLKYNRHECVCISTPPPIFRTLNLYLIQAILAHTGCYIPFGRLEFRKNIPDISCLVLHFLFRIFERWRQMDTTDCNCWCYTFLQIGMRMICIIKLSRYRIP